MIKPLALVPAPLVAGGKLCRLLFGLALLSACITSTARAQPLPDDKTLAIKVVFPHDMSCKTFESQAGHGQILWHRCESNHDGVIAVMQTGLFPEDEVDVEQPQVMRAILQAAVDAYAEKLVEGKWDSLAWIDYQGAHGFEGVGHRLDGRLQRLLSIGRGLRVYYIAGIAPPGRREIEQFFKSIQLN